MKRQLSLRAIPVLLVFLLCLLLTLSYFPIARILAATSNSGNTLQGTSNALLSSQTARTLAPSYAGKSDAVAALQTGATPVSLTLGDLDADGAPDLVVGYTTAKGGVVVVTRGNPDAFAPTDATLKRLQGKNPDALLSKASVFAVPVSPDLIATGDFNRDAKRDVLVAARDGAAYLLAGDGEGNLLAAKQVSLAGAVTAMAASADGHVAVSLMEKNGSQLVILNPGAGGLTAGATYSLPARGDSLAWGNLGGGADLAVGAGANVVMIYGALGAHPQTESVNIPYEVHALAIADFIWDRDGRNEIAILAQDGSIQILQHGTLDTRPLTAADAPGRRAAMMAKSKLQPDPTSLGAWRIAKQLPSTVSASSAPLTASAFSSPRLAPSATHDLMVIDSGKRVLKILDTSSAEASPRTEISFPSAPVAAVALPHKFNGERDVVALTSGQTAVTMMPAGSGGDPTFNVTTTADEDDAGACPSGSTVTTGAGPDGVLSLREAICEANNVDGTSVINVPAGTYSLTISTDGGAGSENDDAGPSSGEIQVGTQSGTTITIAGAGASSTIIEQTDTNDRVFEQDAPFAGNVVVTISNLTIQTTPGGACTTGLDCGFGGGGMLGTGNTGDNLTLTNVTFNSNTINQTANGGGLASGTNGDMTITSSIFSSNTATGGAGGALDFNVGAGGSGNLSITKSSFTGNTATEEPTAEGGAVVVDLSTGSSASISGSVFTGNQAMGSGGSFGGAIFANLGTTVSNSRIVGNTAGTGSGYAETGGTGNTGVVTDNWWGCNLGPGSAGCDTVGTEGPGSVATFNPWIVLAITANPNTVNTGGTSALTADMTHNSNGVGGFSVPDGTPLAFGGTLGTASPTSTFTASGQAASTYTAGNTAGPGTATATVDNQEVTADITINAPLPTFSINKSHTGSFTQGDTADIYTITVSNTGPGPTAGTITLADTLPTGLTAASFSETGHTGGGTGSDWGCSTSPLTCTRTTVMSDGETDTFTLTVSVGYNAPTGTNAVTNQAQVSGGGAASGASASDPTTINVGPGYVLTTSANPSAGGTVTANPTNSAGMPAGHYVPGAVVTLTAAANTGFTFSTWSGSADLSSTTANPTTITMNSATESVTANFSIIIVASPTSTSVSSNNNPSFTAPPGNSVTFTATVTSNTTVNEGTVTFSDPANDFTCSGGNTVPVSNGTATCTTSFTTEGSRVVTAAYNGTVNFQFSSGMITQGVNNHTVVTGNQFCNTGAITVPSTAGAATPYPSNIFVTGLSGNIGAVTVNLNNISSSNIPQTDLLLVGPTGAQIIPFANVGDSSTVSGVNIVLDDAASSLIPGGSPLASGSYKPTSITGSTSLAFPAPAPTTNAANYAATDGSATLTSTFQNTAPNGTWALYAMDNAGNGAASIGGGWCVNITPATAAVTVAKSVTSTGPYNTVGQTISYQFVAKNTGNVTLNAVGILDTQTAPAGSLTSGPTCQSLSSPTGTCSGSTTTLAPGQSATFTGTYTITQADLNNGSVNDSATASGTSPTGSPVTSTPSTATVTTTSTPAVTVAKSVTSTGPYNTVGQTISYSFVAKNTGNVTLNAVGITDTQTAPAGSLTSGPTCQSLSSPAGTCSGSTTTLAPGQSATFTGTYTITQADLNNGSVNDSATASGTPPTGSPVTSSPSTATVTFPTVQITITTSPANLLVSADGGTATTAPLVENWTAGSTHTIATTSPQSGGTGVQYNWSSWSDTGPISHSITVPSTATTYTASFNTQYQLTTQASPSADGTVTPASGNYYASGATIPVTATANSGFQFNNWTSTGGTFDSNTSASTNFHMPAAPATVTGNFANATVHITVTTSPANLLVSVDGGTFTAAPLVETWVIGSSHTIATTSPQSGGTGVQYNWSKWSDGGAISHSITVPGTATTYTATFSTSYLLTTAANPSSEGTVSPASGTFYASGTVVPLTATPNSGFVFKNWTGHVASSSSASTTITMTGPETATANFAGIPGASLSPSPVAFGTVYLNRVHSKVVTLTNGGTGTLDISNISLTPTGGNSSAFELTKTCGATLAPSKACSITIGLSASTIGTDTATLNVTDNAAGSPQHVSVSATVINPQAALSPQSENFGTHKVGMRTVARIVTLTNKGTTPLTIDSVAITGTDPHDFAESKSCPAMLNPGHSCTISVTFDAQAKGARSAGLTITDNAFVGTETIPLSGTGD
jgi:uncharacterized repeat protein (TIGR01451 family)